MKFYLKVQGQSTRELQEQTMAQLFELLAVSPQIKQTIVSLFFVGSKHTALVDQETYLGKMTTLIKSDEGRRTLVAVDSGGGSPEAGAAQMDTSVSSESEQLASVLQEEDALSGLAYLASVELGVRPPEAQLEARAIAHCLGSASLDVRGAFSRQLQAAEAGQEFYLVGAKFWIIWKDFAIRKSPKTPDIALHHNNILFPKADPSGAKPPGLFYTTDFFVLGARAWAAFSGWYPGLLTCRRRLISHHNPVPSNGLACTRGKTCIELEVNEVVLSFVTVSDKGVPCD